MKGALLNPGRVSVVSGGTVSAQQAQQPQQCGVPGWGAGAAAESGTVTPKHSSCWASTWLLPEETLPQEAQDGLTFAVMEPPFPASSWVPW